MRLNEFPVRVADGDLPCLLAEPEGGRLASDPAIVLTFALDRRQAMMDETCDNAARIFVEAGHRALSFDLPHHGDRVVPARNSGIEGMRDAFLAGDDPFTRFVGDGIAVVDACLARGLARPGRIFACGVSRGGYCALRLAAGEPRICGVAGLAPVTDWRVLSEFACVKDRADVAALALDHYAAELAGRPLYMAIGCNDARVGTDCCTRFAYRLSEEQARRRMSLSRVSFHVVEDSEGHSLSDRWRRTGAEFLLALALGSDAAALPGGSP